MRWKRFALKLGISGISLGMTAPSFCLGGDILGHFRGEPTPPSLGQVARMIDEIQSDILNQGTVVVKQPDVWSQARMTKFRREFEDTMRPELAGFTRYISGRIARSDSASLDSQTALGAALTPFSSTFRPQIADQGQLNTEKSTTLGLVTNNEGGIVTPEIPDSSKPPAATFTLLNQVVDGTKGVAPQFSGASFGLEPNVHLDQKADYISHLQRLRRVNLGDDNSDSAGYGLYLMRVPVSIQPGDHTKKGFGAIVNMTMRHDFGPRFLPATYRNLVINDVIDQLAPVVTEAIRTGSAYNYWLAREEYVKIKQKMMTSSPGPGANGSEPFAGVEAERQYLRPFADSPEKAEANLKLDDLMNAVKKITSVTQSLPTSRTGSRIFSIAPSDIKRVFVAQNILNLAYDVQNAIDMSSFKWPQTVKVKSSDVRSYLRHQLESAYDLMEGRSKEQPPLLMDVEYVENLADQVASRKYEGPKGVVVDSDEERNEFVNLYESFTHRLPGNLRYRSIGVLSWAIVIEAGLLNRQLHEDMRQTKGVDGYTCPADLEALQFYMPIPLPDAEVAFQEYIKARWPMITFSLEPVTDQQNIEDAFTRRRDLQLAVAFALSSGRISFRQAITFTRQLQYEAQTIALNQTVSAFAHGNDTFGWRFTPRFQTPPEESNGKAVANLLLRGGPGPNYQLKNTKIEPGMRELTAVVVMPSFVRGMRLDVDGNWFHLHDPDDRKVNTTRTVELGRRINVARHALNSACVDGHYRPEDMERLKTKLHQLEVMLPMQTQFVKVPYENTLGGFALFTQGVSALVPELSGYEGVEYLDTTRANDVIVYGKDLSIYETAVIVGGKTLPREGLGHFVNETKEKTELIGTALSPLKTEDDQLVLVGPDNQVIKVKDEGSYDILSREVMRIRIPKDLVTTTRADGSEVVELYVATPNGISNRLAFPVKKSDPAAVATVFSPIQTAPSYTFVTPPLTVGLLSHRGDASRILIDSVRDLEDGAVVRIQPVDSRAPISDTVSLRFVFPLGDKSVLPPIVIANVPLVDGTYQMSGTMLADLTHQVIVSYTNAGVKIPNSVESKPVLVQPPKEADGSTPPSSKTLNSLQIGFEYVVGAAPVPAKDAIGEAEVKAASVAPAVTATATATATLKTAAAQRATPLNRLATNAVDPMLRQTSAAEANPRELEQTLPQLPPDGVVSPTQAPASAPAPTPATPALAPTTSATAPLASTSRPTTSQTLVVMPSGAAPSVNVTVPIQNEAPKTGKKHVGLFRRQPAGTNSVTPTKGPLMERIMGRP